MEAFCPACGSYANRQLRGGDPYGIQTEDRWTQGSDLYRCVHCQRYTYQPERRYDDRIEWFFDRIAWPGLKWFAAFMALLFLLQILGLI